MITVHGRTRCQFYTGQADWAAIRAVRAAVRIPLVANGDIADAESARTALAHSGADAVMVGRAARGRPWALAGIAANLAGGPPLREPEGEALLDLISGHYEAMLGHYGRELGLRVARKHLGWYLAPLGLGALRDRLVRIDDPGAVLTLLRAAFGEGRAAEAA
jgi:tRNA-dihydrouridine synthase B